MKKKPPTPGARVRHAFDDDEIEDWMVGSPANKDTKGKKPPTRILKRKAAKEESRDRNVD